MDLSQEICIKRALTTWSIRLHNNSSSLNKGNHDHGGVWISDPNISVDFYDFALVLVSREKIYQTLKTGFNHIAKHLEVP